MRIAELQSLLKQVPQESHEKILRLFVERAELAGIRQAVTAADVQPRQNVNALPFDFANYLHNKHICLSGPKVDSHEKVLKEADIIVTCNNSGPAFLADVIYHRGEVPIIKEVETAACVWLSLTKQNKPALKSLEASRVPYYFFDDIHYETNNPWGPHYEWLNCFMKEWGFYPLLGTIALHHLRLFSPKQITVIGMDCHQGKKKEIDEKDIYLTHQPYLDHAYFQYVSSIDARLNIIWPDSE